VTLQARPFAWAEPDSERDTLTPTQDLELSPPFFPLAHGDVQILRLVLPAASTPTGRYFRILLDELPQPGRSRGVSMVLRISLPVFMAPSDPDAAPRLAWRIGPDGTIEARNTGDDWDEVTGLSLMLPGGARRTPRLDATSPYLLPGAARRWRTGAPLRSGAAVRLSGSGRRGAFDLALHVGA
ncbi:MAG: fimbrial biogenesis chaperone, partial [Acetobacteraceae bacterium]